MATKTVGYGQWTDEQRLEYIKSIDDHIWSLELVRRDDSCKSVERHKASKEILELKRDKFDVQNSMSGISDMEADNVRLRRKVSSLEYELGIYRDKYGMVLDNYEGIE